MNLNAFNTRWNISIYNIGPMWCASFYPVNKMANSVLPRQTKSYDLAVLQDKICAEIREVERVAGVVP